MRAGVRHASDLDVAKGCMHANQNCSDWNLLGLRNIVGNFPKL
jgi:hypothetical protein